MDAIHALSDHVVSTKFSGIPAHTIESAKKFILDSIGVGIAGSAGQWTRELIRCASRWGDGSDSRIFVRGTRLPCATAALINAYQIHNSEFDCLHEKAVVHAMTAVLPASLAIAERNGGISGQRLIEAVVVGVDIACAMGLGATSTMKFFRPGIAGGFGATAAVGKLLGFDQTTLDHAFGTLFSQTCGSMQAHEEGTMLLALQIGFNTRNAIHACDLAASGLHAPNEVLEGRFGYYALFENGSDLRPVLEDLGRVWRINELAQKPFPSGRAIHGTIEAIMRITSRHDVPVTEIDTVTVKLTPVASTLVGRPIRPGMLPNYARLCLAYCAARVLRNGTLRMSDFEPRCLADESTLGLASKLQIETIETQSTDAFAPSTVEIRLKNGHQLSETVTTVIGHPLHPMPRAMHIEKFMTNCAAAAYPMRPEAIEGLIALVDKLDAIPDVGAIMDSTTAAAPPDAL